MTAGLVGYWADARRIVQADNKNPFFQFVFLATRFIVTFAGFCTGPAFADFQCSADPAQAVQQARQALAAPHNPNKDREALACVVEALAALQQRVDALGANPDSGRIIPRRVQTKEGK